MVRVANSSEIFLVCQASVHWATSTTGPGIAPTLVAIGLGNSMDMGNFCVCLGPGTKENGNEESAMEW